MTTLANLDREVDLLFLDGWNDLYIPVLTQLEPLLATAALVIADMSKGDPHHAQYRQTSTIPPTVTSPSSCHSTTES